ncbi:MAG: hypothetical protein NUV91_06670 [Candidatus Omnitrophica bacterium]|nr:hypothetical protein [Candidatus Omnitrophota bacterium]
MKRLSVFFILFFIGCASSQIPIYLQDKKPYSRRFFVAYDQALAGTKESLEDLGWKIQDQVAPSVYEQDRGTDLYEKEILLLTEIRETHMVVGTRYARLNIFIRSRDRVSEIEIRYLTVSSLPGKDFKSYQNDSTVDRIFERIEKALDTTSSSS